MSLASTYNPEKTYSNAFTARKLTTPPKSFKASHTQKDRERLLAEGSRVSKVPVDEQETKAKEKKKLRKENVMMEFEITGQRQPKPVDGFKAQSASLPSNKPPLPPAVEEPAISAPPERKRSKPKKTSPPKPVAPDPDESVMEVSLGGELQPFSSGEAGYRDSMGGLESEDWSSKVQGVIGIRRLAMFHSEALIPRLQPVVFAIGKEVSRPTCQYM